MNWCLIIDLECIIVHSNMNIGATPILGALENIQLCALVFKAPKIRTSTLCLALILKMHINDKSL